MSDKKISELTAVTDVQDTDDFVLARSGASKKITGADLKSEVGGSSSFVPTALLIRNFALDIHAAGSHSVTWTDAVDPITQAPVAVVPPELGLTIDLTGVSAGIAPTEAGVWALTLLVAPPAADATIKAVVLVTNGNCGVPFGPIAANDGGAYGGFTASCVAIGDSPDSDFTVFFNTTAAAAANPYNMFVSLLIVRLA